MNSNANAPVAPAAPPALLRLIEDDDDETLAHCLDNLGVLDPSALDEMLFSAARHASASCVRLLLARGANPLSANPEGENPLMVALSTFAHGSVETVEALLPVSDPFARDLAGRTAVDALLTAAGGFFFAGFMEPFVGQRTAAEEARAARMVSLLAPVADFKAFGPSGWPPLCMAAQVNSVEFVRALIPHCDPFERDRTVPYCTPLMHAAACCNVEVARALLPVCDPNARGGPNGLATALGIALAGGLKHGTPRQLAMVDLLSQGKLTDETRTALRKHGPEALPLLAAAAERDALEKALRPSAPRRALSALGAFARLAFKAAPGWRAISGKTPPEEPALPGADSPEMKAANRSARERSASKPRRL